MTISLKHTHSTRARGIYSVVWLLVPLFALLLVGCGDKRVVNERVALNEVRYYLENNPVYETVGIDYGEVRFRQPADSALLDAYQHLEQFGYAHLELLKARKRFLSRDSTFTYQVQLTDKAIPYVLDKTDTKATVQTFYYELDESDPVHLETTGRNRAKVTVTLKQRETDFSMFAKKNKSPNATFIKQTFSLRFDEKSGWRVTR